MANTIDVNKLKNDAFNAIDALFSEDEDNEQFEVEVEEEEPSIEETPPKNKLIVSSTDDFAILDEFILALDWEYSEAEIIRFIQHLKNIGTNNPDPYNQALIKMLNSIITYLIEAKNKAFPGTFNILSALTTVLKKINSPDFDSMLTKSEVSKAYQRVKNLKRNILDYNAKLAENLNTVEDFMPVTRRKKGGPTPEPAESKPDANTFQSSDSIENADIFLEKNEGIKSSNDTFKPSESEQIEAKIIGRLDQYEHRLAFLEEQNKTLRQIITDQKENSEIVQNQIPNTDIHTAPQPENFKIDDFSAELEAFAPLGKPTPETIDVNDILLDKPEFSIPLDKTELETIDVNDIFHDGLETSEPLDKPDPETAGADDIFHDGLETSEPLDKPEPETAGADDIFHDELEAFAPFGTPEPETVDVNDILLDKPEASEPLDRPEPETMDVNDILLDELEDEEQESDKSMASPMEETEPTDESTNPETTVAQISDEKEVATSDEESLDELDIEAEPEITGSEESNEYVQLFKLDEEDIAIPVDYFNNLYKLPTIIKNQIHSMESIRLGELSSFFQKLSKNMKGRLQDVPEKELKKISAEVTLLTEDKTDYQYAVLCSCEDRCIIIPVSDKHKTSTMIAGHRNPVENRLSQFSVEVDDDIIIPLIIPC